jgi:DNA-nicking Smr family endonuclease
MAQKKQRNKESYAPVIDAELDLHGCTSYEAETMVTNFLHESHEKNWKRVRIIVGKGTHSPDGPVLPNTVKALLKENGFFYTYAKISNGGEGALEVALD